MIVGFKTQSVEIPHEPSNFIELRELSGIELDAAEEICSDKAMHKYASLRELFENNATDKIPTEADERLEERDPKLQYDREYVITKAIVGWSGTNYANVPCNDENKLKLDKVTLDFIFREIIRRNTVSMGESLTSVVS